MESLTQTLNVSRSTVNRALNNLEAAKLVQRNDGDYELTLYGRYVYQEYRQLIDRYDTLTAALPLLDHLSVSPAIPGVIFDDATVIQPSPPSPAAPRTRFIDRIRQSEDIVGMGTVVSQRLVQVFHDQLTAHDLQLSLFLDEQVVEHLRHTHHDTLCTALQTDHCMLQSVEQTPPFSLAIVDWTALWLGVYNECGLRIIPRGIDDFLGVLSEPRNTISLGGVSLCRRPVNHLDNGVCS